MNILSMQIAYYLKYYYIADNRLFLYPKPTYFVVFLNFLAGIFGKPFLP